MFKNFRESKLTILNNFGEKSINLLSYFCFFILDFNG